MAIGKRNLIVLGISGLSMIFSIFIFTYVFTKGDSPCEFVCEESSELVCEESEPRIELVEVEVEIPRKRAWYIPGTHCTASERKKTASELVKKEKHDGSNCPKSEAWYIKMREVDPSGGKVFIDIGFNKGFELVHWFHWWGEFNFSYTDWVTAADLYKVSIGSKARLCGVCQTCKDILPPKVASSGLPLYIGYEGALQNVRLLEHMTEEFELHNHSRIYHKAVDKEFGTVKFPNVKLGAEDGGIYGKGFRGEYLEVELTTIDAIMEENNLDHVDILHIDAEGSDYYCLLGAEETFSKGIVRVVEFEYHYLKPWINLFLEDAINYMDGFGFDCYLCGTNRLWKLTGCWHDSFEFHDFSNMMCVLRTDLWWEVIESVRVRFKK